MEDNGKQVSFTGAWRIWFEHPSSSQKQSSRVPKAEDTNPDHNFEIHPLLFVGNYNVTSSLREIKEYPTKNATTAFDIYSRLQCKVTYGNNFVTIESSRIGYNYTYFTLEITGRPNIVHDGEFVYANVYDGNTKIANHIRMVFPRDSEAEKELRTKSIGDRMNVLGIPRVNLNDIYSYKMTHKDETEHEASLPYEMIIVATYNKK